MNEAVAALLVGHCGKRGCIRDTRRILVAEEFHITAKWNRRELPACAVAVVEAKKLRAEPNGENQYPDPASAGDQEMAELVEKHHQRQDEQEGDEEDRDERRGEHPHDDDRAEDPARGRPRAARDPERDASKDEGEGARTPTF